MSTMKRTLFLTLLTILSLFVSAQIAKEKELFKSVPVINNKVAFVKEVSVGTKDAEKNYQILREWARDNYGKDPFISSVRFDNDKHEIVAKSRIELILPENSAGVREKMVMRFRINGFLINDKCVLEITDLSYLHDNSKDRKLPRVIRAEDFITDVKIEEADELQELRNNTKKSTLYFLNSLGKDFEELFGY